MPLATRFQHVVALVLPFGAAWPAPAAAQVVPVSDEFQINSLTTSAVSIPEVDLDPDGNFLVVWETRASTGTDTDGFGIQARRFAWHGVARGDQFQVNTSTTLDQVEPAVAMREDGSSVVVWLSPAPSPGGAVQAQRFGADGTVLGGEFQVNDFPQGGLSGSAIDAADDGSFVVVWGSRDSPGSDDYVSIQARRFGADGTALGSQFQVNTYTYDAQRWPDVVVQPGGEFVVVWSSVRVVHPPIQPDDFSIQARRFAVDGTPLGDEFQVSAETTLIQERPKLALTKDQGFVVVWNVFGSEPVDGVLRARRYAADGKPLGGEFRVDPPEDPELQFGADVAGLEDGGFLVLWGEGPDIVGRRFDEAGTRVGPQFRIQQDSFAGGAPALALNRADQFVVVWNRDYFTDQHRGRAFVATLFEDGFESGDTSAWTGAVP